MDHTTEVPAFGMSEKGTIEGERPVEVERRHRLDRPEGDVPKVT